MARDREIDWERVEDLYRAGQISIREIGRQCGVTDTSIRKKAKREGWERDLSKKVAEKVRSELVRAEGRSETAPTEKEIIEHAAAQGVEIVRSHQRRIGAAQEVADTLLKQLQGVILHSEDIEEEILIETAEDRSSKRRDAMFKAISLPIHSTTLSNLTNAMKTLVFLERQAFNLDELSGANTHEDDLEMLR